MKIHYFIISENLTSRDFAPQGGDAHRSGEDRVVDQAQRPGGQAH